MSPSLESVYSKTRQVAQRLRSKIDVDSPPSNMRSVGNTPSNAGIVFSKDRPMQLDGLIRSYAKQVTMPAKLHVLFQCSSEASSIGYQQIVDIHRDLACFHEQTSSSIFRDALSDLLETLGTRTLFFLVDDIVITRPFNLSVLASFASAEVVASMRLGRNISWSYTRSSSQRPPRLRRVDPGASVKLTQVEDGAADMFAWKWRFGEVDWGYPFSLDGNIFLLDDIRARIEGCEYHSPNSLEAALAATPASRAPAWGVCFEESRLVNLPLNRVQDEVANLHGNVHQDILLDRWLQGWQFNLSPLDRVQTCSVHEEIMLPLELRR